jgi:hypothetical protein
MWMNEAGRGIGGSGSRPVRSIAVAALASCDTVTVHRDFASGDSDVLRARRLLPACLAVFMSGFVAAVVTAINTGITGIDAGYAGRWLLAWIIACPAAIAAAYVFHPLAWRLARLLAR